MPPFSIRCTPSAYEFLVESSCEPHQHIQDVPLVQEKKEAGAGERFEVAGPVGSGMIRAEGPGFTRQAKALPGDQSHGPPANMGEAVTAAEVGEGAANRG